MNKWQELMAGAVDFRDGEIARLKKEITAYKARAEAAEAREKVLSAPVSDGEIHNYGEGVDGEYLEDKRCYETRTVFDCASIASMLAARLAAAQKGDK